MTHGSPDAFGDEVFEEQYHPGSAVIDIFGRGNDIIKKANEADDLGEVREDFDEDNSSRTDRNEEIISSGAPESADDRGGSAGSGNNQTTRALVTNARDSVMNESVPLGSFKSQPQDLRVRVPQVVDASAYNSGNRQAGVSGRAPPTFNDEAAF
jgi:hypothetical protein